MKLTCDLCGGAIRTDSGRGVCTHCGIEYGPDRLREKRAAISSEERKYSDDRFSEKDQKKFKLLWKIFGIICLIAFVGVLMASTPQQEAALFIACVAATLLDFAILMPRKNKGGKKK